MSENCLIINKMVVEDIGEVVVIENLCFSLPWAHDSFLNELHSNKHAHYHVIRQENRIVGYAGLWKVLDEGHITNIAVHPENRRAGIGSKLLEHMFKFSIEQEISSLTLEVRKSNISALKLYKKYGFEEAGIRKAYYSDNNEDAVIMWKTNIGS